VVGRWFSSGTLVSSTNKTEILLKVAFTTITLTLTQKALYTGVHVCLQVIYLYTMSALRMYTNSMSVFKTGDRSYNTYICLHVIGLLWCMWCPFTMHTPVYHCLQGFASFLMSIYVYKGYECLLCMSIYIVYVCLQCLLLLTLSRFTMSTSIFGVSVICLLDIRLLTMSAYVYVYSVRMSTAVST
jgi:hypothetical protein